MNDKVFWSLLGVILVGWVILFALFVMPKMTEYESVTKKLKSSKRDIEKYAKMSPDDLPTSELVEAKRDFLLNWDKQIAKAEQFHINRANLFTEGAVGDLSSWSTRYRDSFGLLVSRYVHHTGYAGETKDFPFKIQDNLADPDQLQSYERVWRIQKDLVDRVLAIRGASIADDGLKINQQRKKSSSKEKSEGGIPISFLAKLPPASVGGLIDGLLRHTYVDFEIQKFSLAKTREGLIYEVVEEVEEGADGLASEPVVWVLLEMNVPAGVVAAGSQ
ncbi:MAG: hypothetical protein HN891_06480 [Planctomycetes bacterium]|jgi:hypothetical protein|nr:hypothetical protein [Planctomycetota bacterium]MBT6453140.1 hypothetical protein [Planctomycetota bacterium]MBT6541361.1 hypothetical protein [Planctomycetota bacterium]MBT6967619.1 hypothetical protein [Planctomycetota bacterium]MBT7103941.1 hypothetical protein [Planctomycetota bacterium]